MRSIPLRKNMVADHLSYRDQINITLCVLFKENFAISQILCAKTWKFQSKSLYSTSDVSNKSMIAFFIGSVVVTQNVMQHTRDNNISFPHEAFFSVYGDYRVENGSVLPLTLSFSWIQMIPRRTMETLKTTYG